MLLFTLLVSLMASVLLALAPAFQAARVQLEASLRQGDTRSVAGKRARRVREGLVVVQLVLAVVLLTVGGLLMRSFVALQHVALGFQPENVLVVDATVATPDPRQEATLFFRDRAALATRYLASLLFEIKPNDPVTYLGVAALLAMTSLVAMYVPASRAASIDPLVALRCE